MRQAPILRYKGDKMITLIVTILTVLFALGSVSPLFITDEVESIVEVERPACSCACSQ